jgi:D-alanine-D-alanine ligase
VALLAGVAGVRAIGAVEVALGEDAIFDFSARHRRDGGTELFIPPRLSAERLRGALTFAERAAMALDASGLVEVDVLVSERGNEYVLEVDTSPSLEAHALLPKIAHASGLEFGALCEAVLTEARLHAGDRSTRRASTEHPLVEERRRALPSEPH